MDFISSNCKFSWFFCTVISLFSSAISFNLLWYSCNFLCNFLLLDTSSSLWLSNTSLSSLNFCKSVSAAIFSLPSSSLLFWARSMKFFSYCSCLPCLSRSRCLSYISTLTISFFSLSISDLAMIKASLVSSCVLCKPSSLFTRRAPSSVLFVLFL